MLESHCPACGAVVPGNGTFHPFCSKRCRLLDLHAWCNEAYGIPADDEVALPESEQYSDRN